MEVAGVPGAMVIVCLCDLWTLPHAIAAKKCTHETYQRQGYSNDLGEGQIRQALGVDLFRGDAVEGRRHRRALTLRRIEQSQHEADADGVSAAHKAVELRCLGDELVERLSTESVNLSLRAAPGAARSPAPQAGLRLYYKRPNAVDGSRERPRPRFFSRSMAKHEVN